MDKQTEFVEKFVNFEKPLKDSINSCDNIRSTFFDFQKKLYIK